MCLLTKAIILRQSQGPGRHQTIHVVQREKIWSSISEAPPSVSSSCLSDVVSTTLLCSRLKCGAMVRETHRYHSEALHVIFTSRIRRHVYPAGLVVSGDRSTSHLEKFHPETESYQVFSDNCSSIFQLRKFLYLAVARILEILRSWVSPRKHL